MSEPYKKQESQCQCGSTKFTIQGEPLIRALCHCTICQEFNNAAFADVTIFASPRENVVVIPSEAIVRSGLQEQVFIVREPGKFEPRKVEMGLSGEGVTEIRKGVLSGDEVVVSAQFLIDSESKLRESAAKMMEPKND